MHPVASILVVAILSIFPSQGTPTSEAKPCTCGDHSTPPAKPLKPEPHHDPAQPDPGKKKPTKPKQPECHCKSPEVMGACSCAGREQEDSAEGETRKDACSDVCDSYKLHATDQNPGNTSQRADGQSGSFEKPKPSVVVPHQRESFRSSNFKPEQDQLWVGRFEVDPKSIEKEPDGTWSFLVPDDTTVDPDFHALPVQISNRDRPDIRRDTGSEVVVAKFLPFRKTRTAAILTTLVIALIPILLLLWLSLRTESDASGRWSKDAIAFWIIDPQTKSYSLQRLQFLLWTCAGVFAFCYGCYSLFVAQGLKTFPELPAQLVGLLGISGATSLAAEGVQNVKGPEGAGASKPMLRDLITTGENVALDKVQLLLWTLVGVSAFIFCIFSIDPISIRQQLPEIPTALLQLAGLSGALYVTGKVVRKPGPVISQIGVSEMPGSYRFELRGTNLSQDANFYIDGHLIELENLVDESGRPQVPEITVQGKEKMSHLVRGLRLNVRAPFIPEESETATFTIENPDGQKAERTFTYPKKESEPKKGFVL